MKKNLLLTTILLALTGTLNAQLAPDVIFGGQTLDSIVFEEEYRFEKYYYENNRCTLSISSMREDKTDPWQPNQKTETTYNDSKHLTTTTYYAWDEHVYNWVNDYKEEITRNQKGLMTQNVNYLWNDETKKWENSYKNEYEFNSKDLLTGYTYYIWENGKWQQSQIGTYTYDSKGNNTQTLYKEYDENRKKMVNFSKYEYTFDANNRLIAEIDYDWDQDQSKWGESWKGEWQYDQNGNETLSINYNWDSYEKKWNGSKKECTYNTHNDKSSENQYAWEAEMSTWVLNIQYKYENSYNSQDMIELIVKQEYDEETQKWENFIRTSYTYTSAGDIWKEQTDYWHHIDKAWNESFRTENTYNADGNEIASKKYTDGALTESCLWFYHGGRQAIEQITNNQPQTTHKVIRNGQIYIVNEGRMYDVRGRKMENW